MTETEYLGSKQVSRSAYAVTTGAVTTVYLGTCELHQRPVRADVTEREDEQIFGALGGSYKPSYHPSAMKITCPEGGGHLIDGERLVATVTKLTCDGSCMSAFGKLCGCGCGGVNHGKAWGTELAHSEIFESALAKYREHLVRVEAKRQQRAASKERKAAETFEAWAAEHADLVALVLASRDAHYILGEFATQLTREHNRKPLSDGQTGLAIKLLGEAAAKAQREAERAANAKPCPVGKTQITGEIVKVTCREGYMPGSVETKATVKCDGYAVWITLPRVVEDWALENRREEIWSGWKPGYHTDYDGASYRWSNALKGCQITLTAQIERSQKDESFGFGKRPSKVTFSFPEPETETQ